MAGSAWDPKFSIDVERWDTALYLVKFSFVTKEGYAFMIEANDGLRFGDGWKPIFLDEAIIGERTETISLTGWDERTERFYRLRWEPVATPVWDGGLGIAATPLANDRYRLRRLAGP